MIGTLFASPYCEECQQILPIAKECPKEIRIITDYSEMRKNGILGVPAFKLKDGRVVYGGMADKIVKQICYKENK